MTSSLFFISALYKILKSLVFHSPFTALFGFKSIKSLLVTVLPTKLKCLFIHPVLTTIMIKPKSIIDDFLNIFTPHLNLS